MSHSGTVFLAGASRGVGREIAHLLVQDEVKVNALLRSEAARPELEALGVTVAIGDALNLAEVQAAMRAEPIWAVISTIGGLPKDGQRADYLGNRNLIDAAVQAGVERFILVSSIGSGNSAVALPPQALQTLGAVLAEKDQAEQHLMASGLTYTIVRPGGLKSEPATGNGLLTPDPTIAGTIHRADVAQLVCRCLRSDRANNRVLSAIDRHMVYGQPDIEELELF
jgi:nucleoside-diphosphate-sugar epimerase